MMSNVTKRRQCEGFTLTELLVVLAILSLLTIIIAPQVLGYLGRAKSEAAHIQLESLVSSLDLYYLDTGTFPTSEQGVGALWKEPEGVAGWRGPYVRKEQKLIDPWGREFQYRLPGEHARYDLFSFGSDNAEGGTDDAADITNW